MKAKTFKAAGQTFAICLMASASMAADQKPMPLPTPPPPLKVMDDGTITVPSFDLPFSFYASEEARDAFVKRMRNPRSFNGSLVDVRNATDQAMMPLIAKAGELYPYTETKTVLGSVPVEIYIPNVGIAPENKSRVLMELHGGAFVAGGGGPGGAVESIPIAGIARIKVVAVDYRMGPENHFPAASEDAAAVYRELLKTYKPQDIGVYGCSAGGMLTAELIPWLIKEKLPLPGAIGILCASTQKFGDGDSFQLWPRLGSVISISPGTRSADNFGASTAYFGTASTSDPLAVPAASIETLKAFPPTLFLTGTRAPDMSGAIESHLQLVELGVKSQLLLFDGMDHGFFSDPNLPESTRAYRLIAKFFAENLGMKSRAP